MTASFTQGSGREKEIIFRARKGGGACRPKVNIPVRLVGIKQLNLSYSAYVAIQGGLNVVLKGHGLLNRGNAVLAVADVMDLCNNK